MTAARRTGHGSGLGGAPPALPGTRILVLAHHGRIRVEEAPGGGAAFRVELPRAEQRQAG